MHIRNRISSLPLLLALRLRCLLMAALVPGKPDRERGDVPGWVMITLMSAVLVAAILAIAEPALKQLFNAAIAQVQK
ncbi:hypothetical protein [Arthrobacter sp.]|uniref:hypothetical protein n=1 Tax=Arthrobacter sp. TaxID=1667 RepID=UPI00289D7086|nr:hypothetical protein [Arthrobacter sp.]